MSNRAETLREAADVAAGLYLTSGPMESLPYEPPHPEFELGAKMASRAIAEILRGMAQTLERPKG